MSTQRFIGFVFLLALLASSGSPSGAADGGPACGLFAAEVGGPLVVAGTGFPCGPDLACDPATQYCSVVVGGPKGVPPGYTCVDVSALTASPTCETIPAIGIGCQCSEADGGVTVTCTAP